MRPASPFNLVSYCLADLARWPDRPAVIFIDGDATPLPPGEVGLLAVHPFGPRPDARLLARSRAYDGGDAR